MDEVFRLEFHDFSPPVTTVLIFNTEAASPWAGSVQGGLLRDMKQPLARFQLRQTLFGSVSRVEAGRSAPCLPTLDRFPQFSAMVRKWPSTDIQVVPETAEIDQTWPFFLLPQSRSFSIRNRRQNTLGPLISRRKRNTETRDRRCVARGREPRMSLTQGRASRRY